MERTIVSEGMNDEANERMERYPLGTRNALIGDTMTILAPIRASHSVKVPIRATHWGMANQDKSANLGIPFGHLDQVDMPIRSIMNRHTHTNSVNSGVSYLGIATNQGKPIRALATTSVTQFLFQLGQLRYALYYQYGQFVASIPIWATCRCNLVIVSLPSGQSVAAPFDRYGHFVHLHSDWGISSLQYGQIVARLQQPNLAKK